MHEEKHAGIGAQKLMTFGRLLGGAGGGGRGLSSSSDSAEHGESVQSRPAPPAGVRRILRDTPSAAGPFWLLRIAIWEPWCVLFNLRLVFSSYRLLCVSSSLRLVFASSRLLFKLSVLLFNLFPLPC